MADPRLAPSALNECSVCSRRGRPRRAAAAAASPGIIAVSSFIRPRRETSIDRPEPNSGNVVELKSARRTLRDQRGGRGEGKKSNTCLVLAAEGAPEGGIRGFLVAPLPPSEPDPNFAFLPEVGDSRLFFSMTETRNLSRGYPDRD